MSRDVARTGRRQPRQFSVLSLLVVTLFIAVATAWWLPQNVVADWLAGTTTIAGFVLLGLPRPGNRRATLVRDPAYAGALWGTVGGASWVIFHAGTLVATDYTLAEVAPTVLARLCSWMSVGGLGGMFAGYLVSCWRQRRAERLQVAPPAEALPVLV
jgi:hypothetical protein